VELYLYSLNTPSWSDTQLKVQGQLYICKITNIFVQNQYNAVAGLVGKFRIMVIVGVMKPLSK
jgi:hypothetical protein